MKTTISPMNPQEALQKRNTTYGLLSLMCAMALILVALLPNVAAAQEFRFFARAIPGVCSFFKEFQLLLYLVAAVAIVGLCILYSTGGGRAWAADSLAIVIPISIASVAIPIVTLFANATPACS